MHDPSFLALEVRAPIPMRDRWRSRYLREGGAPRPIIRRRTNIENLGERAYPWWQLHGYKPRIGNHAFIFPVIVEAWHDEPGGADMGERCNYRERHQQPVTWLWQHRQHLRWKCVPYLRIKSWLFDRCEDCGHRFFWSQARIASNWDSTGVLHDTCSAKRTHRAHVRDLVKYLRGDADWTTTWRVRYRWLGHNDLPATTAQHPYWDLAAHPSVDHQAEADQ